ncbi:MAG TPA: lytic transglycosylase domain-containing protein [Candidatus Acidoferrum sp.]|jgi:soluble lytic murein transglycosylase-like protein|nr:lytic transglycosylase domain-containing protein [Candidatus Acidoferrum sp.]
MRLTFASKPVIPSEVRNLGWTLVFQLRWGALALLLALLAAPFARAEYIVLRSGERLHVTAYQLLGDTYRLQLQGGWVDVQAADVLKIEPEEVFAPLVPDPPVTPASAPSGPYAPPYRELVRAAALRYGVDAELISSVMEVESNFDAKAISPKNARGLMQLLPETAARLGVKDIFDPQQNIEGGTRYLKELLQLYNNNLTLALAAYNAGPEKVQKYGNVPPYRETVSYVNQVKRKYQKSKSASSAKPATPAAPKAAPGAAPPGTSATPPSPQPSPAPKTQDP